MIRKKPVAVHSEGANEFAKNKSKILRLIKELKDEIIVPEEYKQMFDDAIDFDVGAELSKHKDKLTPLIKECIEILEKPAMDYIFLVQNVIMVVDKAGRAMGVQGFDLGVYKGAVMETLRDPKYVQLLPVIIAKALKILKE